MKDSIGLRALRSLLPVAMALALAGFAQAQVIEHKVTASDGASGDVFGWSVSLSGDHALVAAAGDDELGTASGSAYVYERQGDGSWLEVAKLTASDGASGEVFGWSVSLSGERALVGASGDDGVGFSVGSAYVFERQGDGSWLEVAKLRASDGDEADEFGISVSLSGDRALVGADRDDDLGSNSGSAYVYERQGDGSWLEVFKLTASDGAADDHFGRSVSLSDDKALVGAYWDDDLGDFSGSAYVFERQGDGTRLEVAKLTASDGAEDDVFGFSVSLSGDRALVGAAGDDDLGAASGSAYVFENIFTVAIEPSADIPDSYHLSEPYPNPFNPQAQFSLSVSESQHVQIEVFSTLGQRVAVLHDGLLTSRGTHPFTFDAGSLPSGIYLLRVTGETFAATRTMTLLK
ncbi:MAG: T9SS type A sorting domain-containing protein [Bacteroidetes bacterium]|nr:T9SS type A sorting domain-containing protein [Bacteroidota bacterium]